MLSSSVFLLLLNLTPVLAADTFDFIPSTASSSFPQCGVTCSVLLQAQSACVPPLAPSSTVTTYVSCFCESAYLTSLKSSGALCTSCSAADQALLVSWYNGYCNGGYTSTLTATSTATTASSTTSGTAAATTTASSSGDGTTDSSTQQKSWISTHWQWILMIIILIIGFTAFAFAGMWLKKRLDARQPGLYHGDDRNSSGVSRSPAAAFAMPSSLRNFSSRNSTNNTPTPNNASKTRNINIHSQNINGPSDRNSNIPNPEMSTTSLSNNRPDMWAPHQATAHTRDFDDIAPVEDMAFSTAGGGTTNGSRTDISSINTAGGAGGRGTPRHHHRLSVSSAANLHRPHEPVSPVSPIQ